MDDDSDQDEKDQTLTNFWFGNVDERGRLEGAEYIPEVAPFWARESCSFLHVKAAATLLQKVIWPSKKNVLPLPGC